MILKNVKLIKSIPYRNFSGQATHSWLQPARRLPYRQPLAGKSAGAHSDSVKQELVNEH